MDIDTLRAFIQIAEKNTYRNTAASFGISQSTLSKNISALERELNMLLFDRSRRSVTLTPAGEYYYKEMQAFVQRYDSLTQKLAPFSSQRYIRLCAVPAIRALSMNETVLRFKAQHPDYHITVDKAESFLSAAYQMEIGTYSFVLMHKPLTSVFHYTMKIICEDEIVALLPASHPLADQEALCFSQLCGEPLLLNSSMFSILPQVSAVTGVAAKNITKLDSRESIISGVEYNHGVSLLYQRSISAFRMNNIVALQIKDIPKTPIVIVSPYERAFTKYETELIDFIVSDALDYGVD